MSRPFRFFTVSRHNIAFLDLNIIHFSQSPLHLQLFSGGVIKYFNHIKMHSAYEYDIGLIHVDLDVYNRHQMEHPWCRAIMGGSGLEIVMINAMRRSILGLARKNIHCESRKYSQKKDIVCLLDSCYSAMQFTMFHPEETLSPIFSALLTRYGLDASECIRKLSEPSTAPYLVIIQREAARYWARPCKESLDKFIQRAAFLKDPEVVLDGWWKNISDVIDYLNTLRTIPFSNIADRERRANRVRQLNQLKENIRSLDQDAKQLILDYALLYTTLIDHEESRHYWQHRTLRNLTEYAIQRGLDPVTANLRDILDHDYQ